MLGWEWRFVRAWECIEREKGRRRGRVRGGEVMI